MTDFVTDKEEFSKYKSRFNEIFINEDFGSNPFNSEFKYFLAFEFDFIYHELFFEGLKKFLSEIENRTVTFYTIDPSPVEYFYKRYNKYSVFEITVEATDRELNDIMMKDPKKPSGDAIALTSDDITWFSVSNDWTIMGSKDWEVAVVGFTSKETKELFIGSFTENAQLMFTPIKEFVEEFLERLAQVVRFSEASINFYNKLIKNYQDRA